MKNVFQEVKSSRTVLVAGIEWAPGGISGQL